VSSPVQSDAIAQLARLGSATVYEAGGRGGFVDADLVQILPGSRVAGPARTVRCGQGDNLMVHAAMAALAPGDVLVLTMPEPAPVALVGDLLATQAKVHGAAGLLVDAAVRDVEELEVLGLPIWTRWVRVRGATKTRVGALDVPVGVGAATIHPGDVLVLDADGVAVVPAPRVDEVLEASRERERREAIKRGRLRAGALSWEIDGLAQTFAGVTP
jgi:4-hydroxy-4-methyl-2-oxoglutarate aldolase